MDPSHYATFNLQGRFRVQIVTYEDVSVCTCHDVPTLDFNLRTLLSIQLLTHETKSEKIGFTDSKDSVHS